jgi:hypothetical protein
LDEISINQSVNQSINGLFELGLTLGKRGSLRMRRPCKMREERRGEEPMECLTMRALVRVLK